MGFMSHDVKRMGELEAAHDPKRRSALGLRRRVPAVARRGAVDDDQVFPPCVVRITRNPYDHAAAGAFVRRAGALAGERNLAF